MVKRKPDLNLFFDTETFAINTDGVIIQLSGILDIDGEIVDEFNFRCKPLTQFADKIEDDCVKFHKKNGLITKENWKTEFRPANEVWYDLRKWMDKYVDPTNRSSKKFNIIGYNSSFDVKNMRAWMEAVSGDKWAFSNYFNWCDIDVMRILNFLLLEIKGGWENFKLTTVYENLCEAGMCNKIEGMAHDASYDNIMVREIYNSVLLPMKQKFLEE